MLGFQSAASDAWSILSKAAREQSMRWTATINLMEFAAHDGVRFQFERYRQQLAAAALPPRLQAHFELFVGRGYQLFGEEQTATLWLERAAQTASTHGFHQLTFETEASMRRVGDASAREPATDLTYDVAYIADELRDLRELIGAR